MRWAKMFTQIKTQFKVQFEIQFELQILKLSLEVSSSHLNRTRNNQVTNSQWLYKLTYKLYKSTEQVKLLTNCSSTNSVKFD